MMEKRRKSSCDLSEAVNEGYASLESSTIAWIRGIEVEKVNEGWDER